MPIEETVVETGAEAVATGIKGIGLKKLVIGGVVIVLLVVGGKVLWTKVLKPKAGKGKDEKQTKKEDSEEE